MTDPLPPRLVCMGNFTIDDVYLPDGQVMPDCMGGDALYAALGARLWEPRVQMVAPIGNDMPARTLEAIRQTKFMQAGLPKRDIPTMHNRIYYDAQGGRRWEFIHTDEDFYILSPRPEDIPECYRNAEAFLLLAMALESQEALIPWLRANTRGIIALDTQEDYVAGNQERILRLIPQVDIFLPSADETQNLLGHDNWIKAAHTFAELGAPVVVIKLGPRGSLVYSRESHKVFLERPTPLNHVIDTTGAGDAYCGGFLAAYLQDPQDLRKAARAGAISASFAISSFGMDALLKATPAEARHLLQIKGDG